MCFGPDVCNRFLDDNNLELLIRSHEVKDNGFEIHTGFNNRLITVFSAPNYCDQV
jgi:serine/threonine-protein phosphatase 5